MASITDRFLMIPREIPSYLKVAYSVRYKNEPNSGNLLERICKVVQRTFALIREILSARVSFFKNREKLAADFEVINQKVSKNQKPLCVYFVSAHDFNGAILGNHLYYYHHYKIQGLQKYFAVAPKVVSSQKEMKDFMLSVKKEHAGREIKFVDIVTHGGKSSLAIQEPNSKDSITVEQLEEELFSECAPDATILLDACTTGLGDKNIADEIARKTPGRKVLAPGPMMFFSKPVIKVKDNNPKVVSAVHGFAIFNAYECKSFSYPEKMTSQYPYVKDKNLAKDIFSIVKCAIVRNARLDRFVKDDRDDLKKQILSVFDQLSEETKALVIKRVDEKFLRENPLHISVRSALRATFNELIHEVREYPRVNLTKMLISILNVAEYMRASFRFLICRQAIA